MKFVRLSIEKSPQWSIEVFKHHLTRIYDMIMVRLLIKDSYKNLFFLISASRLDFIYNMF